MSLLLLFFVVLLAVLGTVLLLAVKPTAAERAVQARLTNIRNPRRALRDEVVEADLARDADTTLSQRLSLFLKRYSFSARIEKLLLEADSSSTVGSVILNSVRSAVAGSIVGVLFSRTALAASLALAAGFALPVLKLRYERARRLKAATRALPDTADLMARALRAGHSMTQVIEVLAEQAPSPLREEFSRIFQQQRLGVPLREVFLEFSRRLPSRDIQFLVTAILVQRETGGDLVQILDRTTDVLRERIRVQGEVQVQTAQGRMTGWILSLLPVALLGLITLFSRDYTRILFEDPVGRTLLYSGAASILIGALIIRRIVKVTF